MSIYYILCITTIVILLSVSGILYWFIRKLIDKLYNASENFSEILESIKEYHTHIEKLYETPVYFEEPSIKYLLLHTREIKEELKDFIDSYSFYTEENNSEDENFDKEETEEEN